MNLRIRAVPISNIPKKSNVVQASTNKFSNAAVNRNLNDKGKSMEQNVDNGKNKEKNYEEAVQKDVVDIEILEKNDVPEDFGVGLGFSSLPIYLKTIPQNAEN